MYLPAWTRLPLAAVRQPASPRMPPTGGCRCSAAVEPGPFHQSPRDVSAASGALVVIHGALTFVPHHRAAGVVETLRRYAETNQNESTGSE